MAVISNRDQIKLEFSRSCRILMWIHDCKHFGKWDHQISLAVTRVTRSKFSQRSVAKIQNPSRS
jgi:hypothetical protein